MRIVCALLISLLSLSVSADPAENPISSFEKMKSLIGEWKNDESDGKDFYILFQSSANGSVLIEHWIYKGESHSITVYHPDGEDLLATHYCPQGNQPRLKLESSSNGKVINFAFKDATNLGSLQDNHQHSLAFEFIDNNTLIRKESYSKSGAISPSVMRLVRR